MTAFDNLLNGLTTANTGEQAPATPIDPVPLALALFDYQDEAVRHALRDATVNPYAYVGLDMGLGKTPVGITIAASLSAAGIKPTLVVVPPSLRINWAREFRKFAPWLVVATITGSKPEVGDSLPDVDVVIVGDSGLAGWADFLTGKIGGLIVDEAHRFKNAKSNRGHALVQLATGIKVVTDKVTKRTVKTPLCGAGDLPKMRVLMSGTPMPNGRHLELASQVDVLGDQAWRDLGGKGMFWHHYAPQVDSWGGRASNDPEGLNKAMTGTWFFRRLRDQVLDLPNKGRSGLALEGAGKAVKEYKTAEADFIAWLADRQDGKVSRGQLRSQALIKMNALRRLAGEAKVASVVDHVKELLDEEPGGVFVVAEHRDVIDNLMLAFRKYNPTCVAGGQSDAEKQDAIDRFCDGRSRVLVGQVVAAGVGLTLHGNGLNHRVVVAQLPWTPADLRQAEDRLHRIGQTHDVMVEVALATIDGCWTIDERLWAQLERKNFNASIVCDGEADPLIDTDGIVDGILDTYRS